MERWSAHGNVYLVTEQPLDPGRVRRDVGDADGIAEVTAHGDDWGDVVIWNPDGSTAEMSGNATRALKAAWCPVPMTSDSVSNDRSIVSSWPRPGTVTSVPSAFGIRISSAWPP